MADLDKHAIMTKHVLLLQAEYLAITLDIVLPLANAEAGETKHSKLANLTL